MTHSLRVETVFDEERRKINEAITSRETGAKEVEDGFAIESGYHRKALDDFKLSAEVDVFALRTQLTLLDRLQTKIGAPA